VFSADSWSTSLARDTQRRVDAVPRFPGPTLPKMSLSERLQSGSEVQADPSCPTLWRFFHRQFSSCSFRFHATVRGRSAKKLSLVRRNRPPSCDYHFSVRDSLFDGKSNIGKCLAQTEKQRAKLLHVDLSVLLDLAVTDRIR